MIIRAKTFRAWFKANLSQQSRDIANHGADAGWPCITYTTDTVKIFDRFDSEIWDLAYEEAQSFGCKSVPEFIAGFRRIDMADDIHTFKNLMVWFACEHIAREMHPDL